ncbi:transposase domain-containing protein [Rhodanobacter umsongensis]|uniref:Transposase domain-containing protein n=1 Tax=Rhodanobacter umsongensis TaxID=633153 RepID=A0ABW0JKP5_9GAMM
MITALQTHLDAAGELSPDAAGRFSQIVPADWIEHALQATGMASLRRHRLPVSD